MRKYRIISRKGEGTFATVVKAQHTQTRELFAIKCMKSSYKNADQVSSLREIQAIKRLSPHPNIVKLEEVLFDPPSGRLALVFELLEGNLYELMKGRTEMFSKDAVKSFMRQIFTALTHMHSKGVFHRDIKPENILFDKSGKRLKLADFGSCRGINGKPPFTEYISTRWYRPPEVLLTSGMYGPEMDVWGAGCILFELTTLYPLFPGTDEVDQINRIHKVLGTPSKNIIDKLKPHVSNQVIFRFSRQEGIGLRRLLPDAAPDCLDLLTRTTTYDKTNRITSKRAMKHSYFVGDLQSKISSKSSSTTGSMANGRSKVRKHQVAPTPTTLPHQHSHVPKKKHAAPPKVVRVTEHNTKESVDKNNETAAPKTRSMVSILLQRSQKKDFVAQSKERNKTFYRTGRNKKKPPAAAVGGDNDRHDGRDSFKKRQSRKFKHVQSSGYGL